MLIPARGRFLPNVMWSGDNPFQTKTESWGNAIVPPIQTSRNFNGTGVPAYDPPGSRPGDTYTDTSVVPPKVYVISDPINYGP